MAEIVQMPCRACATLAPASPLEGLRRWFARRLGRRNRIGNVDDLPDRLRRDMGLPSRLPEPSPHYRDYITSNGS